MVIRRVSPMSVAKIAGLLYAIIGLVFGAFVSLFALVGAAVGADGGEGAFFGAVFGIGAVILLPLFYGCLGFVMSAIMAWLYNVLAGAVGGVEIEAQ